MFRTFFTKRASAKHGAGTSRKTSRAVESVEQSAKLYDDDSFNILLRYSDSTGVDAVFDAIDEGFGKGKANVASWKTVHREVSTRTLALPEFTVTAMIRERSFSRNYNYIAARYFTTAHEDPQAFMYSVHIPSKVEEYLSLRSWEEDRTTVTQMLRLPGLVEHPNKPLLLLVTHEEKDDDFDLERLVTLFGLGRLQRPFRAVAYSKGAHDSGTLKEALDWLTTTANSKDDESTAMMTGYDTEDDSSVVTSNSTAVSMAKDGHYVLDYEPTLLGGNATLQWFEPIKKGTHCPFARAAKLWGGKLVEEEQKPRLYRPRSEKDIREVASLNSGPLAEFVTRSKNGELLDGFCLLMPVDRYRVEDLGQDVRILLTQLADLDPTPGENAMRSMGNVDDRKWRFRFAGEDFFITTFSPLYKKHSSRYTFGVTKTFVLFQPLASFGRHGLVNDTPASATNWENPTTMRDKARVAFKKNGCPYHIPEELPYPVAEHIVKPAKDDGTSSIRWWEPMSDDSE